MKTPSGGPPRRPAVSLWWGALAALVAPTLAPADEIAWRNDYARARQEAAATGKPIVLELATDSCFWCKQLDSRTFADPAVVALLNSRCIPVKLDGNKHDYLVKALKLQTYPTIVYASPEGKILGYQEGFLEPGPLHEQLQKVLAIAGTPDWMARDFEEAGKALGRSDFPRALTLLRGVVEDGKERAVQIKARQTISELERQAAERTARAQTLIDKGKPSEAVELIQEVSRSYPGTEAARQGKQLLVVLASRTGTDDGLNKAAREKQARDLLRLAREDHKAEEYLVCLDRCDLIANRYPDLPEGGEAGTLAAEIRANPEWTRKAADQMGERLAGLWLSLAEAWTRKGQPQQAVYYLERIVKTFPGTRHAEAAQVRLARLQAPASRVTEDRR